jgi:hypothetical protein
MSSSREKDLRGERFGTLTVIREHTERSKHNQRLWVCSCDCGSQTVILQHSLVTGNTKRCAKHPKNEWRDCGDYVELDVSTKKYPNTFTKISKDDLGKCLSFKKKGSRLRWMVSDNHEGKWSKYVSATDRKTHLHRWIVDLNDPNLIVDHLNGDGLDNRRENLRVCTRAENNKNMRKRNDNSSGYAGVHLETESGLYVAKIQVEGKVHFLGRFDRLDQANIAYRSAAKVLGFSERHGI